MPPKDLFSGHADLYKTFRPDYPADLYKFIMQHVSDSCLAWDVGTGNGQVARVLSSLFTRVYATDISEEQLAKAHPEENICYAKCSAENSGLPHQSVDLITVAQALHWFDFEKFNAEVNRVARPDAIIAVWGYELLSISPEIDALISAFYKNVVGPFWQPERKHIEDSYQSVPFPFDQIASPEFHIEVEWSADELKGYLNTWSSVQKFIEHNKSNPVNALMNDVLKYWNEPAAKKIVFPLFMRLGRVK